MKPEKNLVDIGRDYSYPQLLTAVQNLLEELRINKLELA